MTSDANFESFSNSSFTVNDKFINSESDPHISFYGDISPLDTKYFNPKEIHKGFKFLSKNGFPVLYINIRSINKNFEAFKKLYPTFNCTFSVIFVRNMGY